MSQAVFRMTAPAKARTVASDRAGDGRPLRIVVGLNRLWIAGAELNAVDLATKFHERGHFVVIVGQEEDDRAMVELAEHRGLEVRILPRGRTPSIVRPLEEIVKDERIDVIHMYYSKLTTAALLGPYRRWGTPVVTTEYGPGPVVTPACSHLVVGTEECAAGIRPWFHAPVSTIEPPVDIDRDRLDAVDVDAFLSRYDIDDVNHPRVVVVSRVDRRVKLEGIQRTINACAELGSLAPTVVVVGDGDALADVRRAADQVNAHVGRRAVVITGRLSDPRPAYAAADVVVGMGGSALRGLAFGKPVVVLGTAGFALPFEPATAEYFFWHGFFGQGPMYDLTASLRRILNDAALRARLGQFGRQTVESRYSLDVAYDRLRSIYLAAVQEGPTGSDRWRNPAQALAHYTLAHYGMHGLWRSRFATPPVAYT